MPAAPTDLFLSLTPERVLLAITAAGLECRSLCYPLNSYENRVYEIELVDGERVVAKFYRPQRWSREQILEEHRFLAELHEAEVPVCPMRMLPGGSTLRRTEHIYYALADRRGGRAPDELDARDAERLGMLVGRMHNVGASHGAGSRRRLDADQFVRRTIGWLESHATLPTHLETRYLTAAESIARAADRCLQRVDHHRIHADLHVGNVLYRDGRLRVLDFDDMAIGPAVQDLWLALPGRDEETGRLRRHFIRGYEQFRHFDDAGLGLIEVLRGMRLVRYAGWLARRWHDPAFRTGWPHFGTPEYWEGETRDLEEQVEVISRDESPPSRHEFDAGAPLAGDTDLLDNSDYFWDWEEE